MKNLAYALLLATLCLPPQQLRAQEKSQEKPRSEERAKPAIPVKVQVVFTEYDGDKKISIMPYSFIAIPDEKVGGYYSASLRTGVRIPIEIESKDQKTTYIDVGSNIDCGIRTEEEGRFHLYMIFERSALYPTSSMGNDKVEVSRPNGQPLIRQFKSSENLILKDGQTVESTLSIDPLNGHVIKLSVTINVQK
jgi:hypothetical protein